MRSIFLVSLLALSATAAAEGFDYDYFSVGYGVIDFDEVGVDGDGYSITGSVSLAPKVHLFAGYDGGNLDFDVDVTTWGAGIGYNTSISERTDAYARLSYEYIEVDVPLSGSADDNGFGFGVGLRYRASDQLELNGGLNYVDYGDAGDDTGIALGGLYSFTEKFALGLSGEWSDDVSQYGLHGRFYFGN